MKKLFLFICTGLIVAVSHSPAGTEDNVLKASKDTFCRSNERNANSGASRQLLIAHSPGVRSIVGFDLSTISNEITKVEFQIWMETSMPDPVTLMAAPMAPTENNAAWIEGSGALGAQGQNAVIGDATFSWRAFRDQPWESEAGTALTDIGDSALWKKPAIKWGPVRWQADQWLSIPIEDVALLEQIRTSEIKTLTMGLWGISGNGLYAFGSKESGHAPQLVFEVKEAYER